MAKYYNFSFKTTENIRSFQSTQIYNHLIVTFLLGLSFKGNDVIHAELPEIKRLWAEYV